MTNPAIAYLLCSQIDWFRGTHASCTNAKERNWSSFWNLELNFHSKNQWKLNDSKIFQSRTYLEDERFDSPQTLKTRTEQYKYLLTKVKWQKRSQVIFHLNLCSHCSFSFCPKYLLGLISSFNLKVLWFCFA